MGMVERLSDLDGQVHSVWLGKQMICEDLRERRAAHKVTDDINGPVTLADFVDTDDVGMPQLRCRLCFPDEVFSFEGGQLPLAWNLDGYCPVQHSVAGLPHGAEGPDSNALNEFEPPQSAQR